MHIIELPVSNLCGYKYIKAGIFENISSELGTGIINPTLMHFCFRFPLNISYFLGLFFKRRNESCGIFESLLWN